MMPSPRSRAPWAAWLVSALTLVASFSSAHAQVRLPEANISLPGRLPGLDGDLLRRGGMLPQASSLLRPGELTRARPALLKQLLERHPAMLEADPRGAPVLRRELLAFSPGPAVLAAARALGLRVLREQRLEGLDETVITFAVPEDADTARMLERLQALDPEGVFDFNHIYQGGGSAAPAGGANGAARPAASGGKTAVGLVDGGVDPGHPVFAGVRVQRWGCQGALHPSVHGNAVAALMVGRSDHFSGVLKDAELYAADIYCGSPTGGAADAIAGALDWMALQRVPVINLSIVGPPNRTLERAVAALLRRGHVLVAAVGNDGPAAPALYPASYPGVVGVTAVNRRGNVIPEAARGPHVKFAAPGSDMVSASLGQPPYRRVRGTSFAAPIVAALLAERLRAPDPAGAAAAIAALAQQAGSATPNPETGHGVVGSAYRTDPSDLRRDID